MFASSLSGFSDSGCDPAKVALDIFPPETSISGISLSSQRSRGGTQRKLGAETGSAVRALGYPSHTRTEWAEKITGSWVKAKVAVADAVTAIFHTGDTLEMAKRDLGHGNWLEMAQNDLPFSVRQAQILMKIARDARLTKNEQRSYLPGSVPVLHALTLLNDEAFEALRASGGIHQHMTPGGIKSARYLESKGKAYLLKTPPKAVAKKLAKAPAKAANAKAAAPPRPQPFDASTAKDLHVFVTKLAAYMRGAPSNIAASTRFLMPDERRELAECATDAIAWLNKIYDAVQPKRDKF
jgi:hypothetical protein